MNPKIQKLQTYPFERLAKLKAPLNPPNELEHIALSLGEPKHPAPEFVLEIIKEHLSGLSSYPLTKGDVRITARHCKLVMSPYCLGNIYHVTPMEKIPANSESV